MTDKVVSLDSRRTSPHYVGQARCANCGHLWQTVAPVGTWQLECPECHTLRGRFYLPFGIAKDEQIYTCVVLDCGGQTFVIIRKPTEWAVKCERCGTDHDLDTVFPRGA